MARECGFESHSISSWSTFLPLQGEKGKLFLRPRSVIPTRRLLCVCLSLVIPSKSSFHISPMFIAESLNNSSLWLHLPIHVSPHWAFRKSLFLLVTPYEIYYSWLSSRQEQVSAWMPSVKIWINLSLESGASAMSNQIQNWLPLPCKNCDFFVPSVFVVIADLGEGWARGDKRKSFKEDSDGVTARQKRRTLGEAWDGSSIEEGNVITKTLSILPAAKLSWHFRERRFRRCHNLARQKTKISRLPLFGMKISLALVWRTRHGS